jgi:hypothetical protein
LAGHEHHYERFAPMSASGAVDPQHGIRSLVVGTGGKKAYGFGKTHAGSDVRHSGTFGVLQLSLLPDSYSWSFVPVSGGKFSDSGSDRCHDRRITTAASGEHTESNDMVDLTALGLIPVAVLRWDQGGRSRRRLASRRRIRRLAPRCCSTARRGQRRSGFPRA